MAVSKAGLQVFAVSEWVLAAYRVVACMKILDVKLEAPVLVRQLELQTQLILERWLYDANLMISRAPFAVFDCSSNQSETESIK